MTPPVPTTQEMSAISASLPSTPPHEGEETEDNYPQTNTEEELKSTSKPVTQVVPSPSDFDDLEPYEEQEQQEDGFDE